MLPSFRRLALPALRVGLFVCAVLLLVPGPSSAQQQRAIAQQRFEDANRHYAAAAAAFGERLKKADPEVKELPADVDWAARSRCDQAEVLIRLRRPKEARDAATPVTADKLLSRS